MSDVAAQRQRMVRTQIERRGIRDARVLQAMRDVPREAFVPPALRYAAYDDRALPLDAGQTISQPYVVAWMIEALELRSDDRVLEVGTGSGYAAAVLGALAAEVWTVERLVALAAGAAHRLEDLGYRNVHVRVADGSLGAPDEGPFDAILVSAGAPEVPPALVAQLAPGGRLLIPCGASRTEQTLVCVRKVSDNSTTEDRLLPVRFVPLIGAQGFPEDDGPLF